MQGGELSFCRETSFRELCLDSGCSRLPPEESHGMQGGELSCCGEGGFPMSCVAGCHQMRSMACREVTSALLFSLFTAGVCTYLRAVPGVEQQTRCRLHPALHLLPCSRGCTGDGCCCAGSGDAGAGPADAGACMCVLGRVRLDGVGWFVRDVWGVPTIGRAWSQAGQVEPAVGKAGICGLEKCTCSCHSPCPPVPGLLARPTPHQSTLSRPWNFAGGPRHDG